MKKVCLLVTCLFLCGGIVFAQKPKVEFKKMEHNFGTIKEEAGAVTTPFGLLYPFNNVYSLGVTFPLIVST